MCGPTFCSMKITDDVRKYAEEHGYTEQAALEEVEQLISEQKFQAAMERVADWVEAIIEYAVEAGAEIIMLDNMDEEQIRTAVAFIDKRAVVEVSGGITKSNLKQMIDTGVDIISIGALTHGAGSVDISMKIK